MVCKSVEKYTDIMLFLVLLEREENQQRREQSGQRDGVAEDVQRVYQLPKLEEKKTQRDHFCNAFRRCK